MIFRFIIILSVITTISAYPASQTPAYHLKQGFKYFYRKDYNTAVEQFNKAINKAITLKNNEKYLYSAYYNLGFTMEKKEDYIKAVKYYNKALNVFYEKAKKEDIIKKLKHLIDSPFKVNNSNLTEFDSIINIYNDNLDRFSNKPLIKQKIDLLVRKKNNVNFIKANELYKNKKYEEALQIYDSIKEEVPEFPSIDKKIIITEYRIYEYYIYGVLFIIFLLLLFLVKSRDRKKAFKQKKKTGPVPAEQKPDTEVTADYKEPDLRQKAYNLYMNNRYEEALPVFASLVYSENCEPQDFLITAIIYNKFNDIQSSLKIIKQIEPAKLMDNYKKEYYLLLSRLTFKSGLYQESIEASHDYIRLDPDNAEVYMLLSEALINIQDYEKAVSSLYEAYLKDNNKLSEIDSKLFSILGKDIDREYKESAYGIFEKISSLPDDRDELKQLANFLININLANKSIPVFIKLAEKYNDEIDYCLSKITTLISYNEKNIIFLKGVIKLYDLSGNTDKMIETYRKLTKQHPEKPLIDERKRLAELYINCGETEKAVRTLKILTKFEKDTGILKTLGELYIKVYNINEAKIIFEELLQLNSENNYAIEKLAAIKRIQKNKDILKCYNTISSKELTESAELETKYRLSELYYNSGLYDLAIEELKSIVKEKNEYWLQAINLTAQCYIALQDTDKAIDYYIKNLDAVTGKDDINFLKYNLACAYKIKGDSASAIDTFKQILAEDKLYFDVADQLSQLTENSKLSGEE